VPDSSTRAEIARSLDRNGRKGVDATVAATTYRGMNALHAALRGVGKLAACRYLVDTIGMDVNMWDTSPSNESSPPSSSFAALVNCPSSSRVDGT
jgi:hypothetical protein